MEQITWVDKLEGGELCWDLNIISSELCLFFCLFALFSHTPNLMVYCWMTHFSLTASFNTFLPKQIIPPLRLSQ